MMRVAVCQAGLLIMLLLAGSHAIAQTPVPIDVFVTQDVQAQTATIAFTNPVTGLSTPVTIQGFGQDQAVLDALTLLPDGVLFQHPVDGRILIATPDGQVIPHPFIPQQSNGLVEVNPVLSPDQQQIAWVEAFISNGIWISNLYVANLDGSDLIQLPAPPDSELDVYRRAVPVALSNNREMLLIDTAFPTTPRSLSEYFTTYADLYSFDFAAQRYQQVPGEPLCACDGGLNPANNTLVRLEDTPAGYVIKLRDLRLSDTALTIPPTGTPFLQAGDLVISQDGQYGYYTQAQSITQAEGDTRFSLMQINFATRTQAVLFDVSDQRWRVMGEIENGLLLVDVYGEATYKYDFPSQTLTRVADQIWLGTIYR